MSEVLFQESRKIDNLFLSVYINNFIRNLRNFNKDKFIISILGLKSFTHKADLVLTNLIQQLQENNFIIKTEGNEESVNHLDITCKNTSKNTSYNYEYQIQNLPAIIELSSKTDIPVVAIIIMKVVAQIISKSKILYKAIVLDLDDTLWKGTISEVGIGKIIENMHSEGGVPFIEFMKFVKTLGNELGVFITICSRNDSTIIESAIEELDENIFPLKNQIDYIVANNNDKSENIRMIAKRLSILPCSIVFIDDNQIARDEVRHRLSEVFVPEWANHNELVTQLNAGCIFERVEWSLNSQNKRKQFRIIQTERIQNSVPKLSIKAINDINHTESIKLYSKSNQFKFSSNDNNFDDAKSLFFEIFRGNGDNLGICSAITYTHNKSILLILNWAISCRYFEIGLEEFILKYIQNIANEDRIFIYYENSDYNQKVSELFAKYSNAFCNNDNVKIEIIITKEIADKMNINTSIREL